MESLAIVEFAGSIFIGIALVVQFFENDRSRSMRRILITSFMALIWLLSDALGYTLNNPETNYWADFWFLYILNLMPYIMSSVVAICFLKYCDVYLNERIKLNKWTFRIPILFLILNIFIDVIYFANGKLVSFENGYIRVINYVPSIVLLIYICTLIYPSIVAFMLRKDVGTKSFAYLLIYCTPILLSIISVLFTDYDIMVLIGAVSTSFIMLFLQNELKNSRLSEMLTFTDYFLSTYSSAYYVDLRNGSCKIYKRTSELKVKYPIISNYFDFMSKYINKEVHPEDRENFMGICQPEKIKESLSVKSELTHLFRNISDEKEKIYRLQVIRGADENHAAFGFVDISNEIIEQNNILKQAEESQKIIDSITSAYNVAYIVNMADDSFKLLRMDENVAGSGMTFNNFTEVKEFFISNVLIPSEKDKILYELNYDVIRGRLRENKSYNVEYRALLKGSTLWHEMNISYIDENEVTIGFAQKNLEITKRRLEEKTYDEFYALFVVDLDTELIRSIKNESGYYTGEIGSVKPFSEAMMEFADRLEGDAREFFILMSDLSYVRRELAKDDKRTYSYKSRLFGDEKWIDVVSYVLQRHEDGGAAVFTLGFSAVDSLASVTKELQSQLETARNDAEAASRSKSRFLFNMSHDIRTPMNAITGFTAMAKMHLNEPDKLNEYLNKIDISGKQLITLINQVLEMARIESGKVEFDNKPVNIREEFNSMVTVLYEQAKSNGLVFNYSLENIEHNSVLADKARMGSITLNVAGNAMKYTPRGGCIDFSLKEIPARKDGYGTYVFSVIDTGMGMSEEYLKLIYEPFSREKNSTVSNIQGTGLGMSIVKNLVDLLGGTIEVKSKEGIGTRFDITVDLEISKEQANTEDTKIIIPEYLAGHRVLVVDDKDINREIVRAILEDNNLITEEAEDGDVAVAMVKNALDRGDFSYFDLILMDIQMPRMNGYDATIEIRKLQEGNNMHIPIVAMTANAFAEDKQNAYDAGMDGHLAKPIVIRELLEVLVKFMT